MRWKKKHKWAVLMSCRGSGGHLFVCTGFHKQCAVNHLRWRVSASQRRVQPALNTEDGRGTILLWLFRLIASHAHTLAHTRTHTHTPNEMLLQMFGIIVAHLQFQSSGCFPTISVQPARTRGRGGPKLHYVAAKWKIEKRAIMIHPPGSICGPTGQ